MSQECVVHTRVGLLHLPSWGTVVLNLYSGPNCGRHQSCQESRSALMIIRDVENSRPPTPRSWPPTHATSAVQRDNGRWPARPGQSPREGAHIISVNNIDGWRPQGTVGTVWSSTALWCVLGSSEFMGGARIPYTTRPDRPSRLYVHTPLQSPQSRGVGFVVNVSGVLLAPQYVQ